jgi:hypothetical protein
MYEEHRRMAENALRLLLVGATFVGAQWYGMLTALVARAAVNGRQYDLTYSEIYLSIESRCALFANPPSTLPDWAEDLPHALLHEQVEIIARLARDPITDVTLGEHHPHLILAFESGRIFFLNGYHEQFESWTVQTRGAEGGEWTIVAIPESDIAVFDPANTVDLAGDL